jgi:hypothetical protein
MKPSTALQLHRAAVRVVVESHRAGNVRVFGSVLRRCDTDQSDLDLLVDPTPDMTLLSGWNCASCSVCRWTCSPRTRCPTSFELLSSRGLSPCEPVESQAVARQPWPASREGPSQEDRLPVIEVIGTLSRMNYKDEMHARRAQGATPAALAGPTRRRPA